MTTSSNPAGTLRKQLGKLAWFASDREEQLDDIPFVPNSVQVLGGQNGSMPNENFYFGLRLYVTGRF